MSEEEFRAKLEELNKRLMELERLQTPSISINPLRLSTDLDDVGSVKTHLDFEEAPLTPVTPPADVARLYAEDDGAETATRLIVKVSDGSTIVLHPLALTADISPAQIVANTDNYSPTNLATAAVLRLSTDTSRNITGLAGGSDGRVLFLFNVGSFDIVLVHDATSTAANRFYCPNSANLTVVPNGAAILLYDTTSSRWRVFLAFRALVAADISHNVLDGSVHLDTLAGTVVLGDLVHGNATPKWAKLGGNTTTTRKFLRQTGDGAASAVPVWDTLVAADLPAGSVTTHTLVRKTADESVTNNTLQNDDHLTMSIAANEIWIVEFTIFVKGHTSGDIRVLPTVPTGATGAWGVHGLAQAVTSVEGDAHTEGDVAFATGLSLGLAGTSNVVPLFIHVLVVNGSNAGSVTLQWAQVSTFATATTVLTNSYLLAHKIA